nr:helix-turn-helix domain-containing protein [uncultured Romboutsia sp.]
MQSLIEFFEKETNKKINIFKYNNEKINSNQNLIEFNNTTYVIEFLKDSILNHINGYCYLFNQQNLDFDSLKNVLHNLYEDVQIYNYNNYLLLVSDDILDIDTSTPTIIESETYSKTHIIYLEKITTTDNLDFKISIVNELINIIINDSNASKFITLNDLIIYKIASITSNNKQVSSLIKFDIIKSIDENLLTTGINFIENGLNISKTSSVLFLHRNTLVYRLEKIKDYLNLDLKNFKDAFIFYLSVKSFLNFINNYN